jgi:hypothetical protein
MRKAGQEGSEVVDLPQVIGVELKEIVRRRDAVDLRYADQQSSPESTDHAATSNSGTSDDGADAKEQGGGNGSEHDRIKQDLVGLAFSGGGIRSASFNLGLFQALHRAGVIRHTDYLSTVSGGGYIGAHLASLVLARDIKMDRRNFPLAPKERGEQPERVVEFIRGGRYLVRQPLVFARWYLTGVALNNLVLFSGLFAFATLTAMLWRALDTWPMYDLLRTITFGWSADWNRPFFPAAVMLMLWIVVKAYRKWRSGGSSDGGLTTICLLMFYGCVAIAFGVLLGNGDIGGLNWSRSQSRDVWVPLLVVLGILLLPLLRPWRLLQSGTRPANKTERAIFKLTSYALLAGVPITLIGYLAHEDISGYSTTRTALTEKDIRDWRLLTQIELPIVSPDTSQSARSNSGVLLDQYLKTPGSAAPESIRVSLTNTLGGAKSVTSSTLRRDVFRDNKTAADAFFADVLSYINQNVIASKAFAEVAAAEVDDSFWDELDKKEEAWRKEADDKVYRRDDPEGFADYQTLSDDRKTGLASMAKRLSGGGALDNDKLALFNRLYLEAAQPESITNRNRILRTVVAVPDQARRLKWFCVSLAIFVVGIVLIDPNGTSIHRYYSRQLSRGYIEPVDGLGRRSPICRLDTVAKGAPYLLINATVNHYGRRGASIEPRDIFIFSRKFCGSPSTRFCPSSQYLGGTFDLANAMAISGGAVTTSSVKNPLVAVMMFVLNLRLGQWLPNPREQRAYGRPAKWQVLVDLFRDTRQHSFCFISDGGHRENLGALSLLERKCKIIVVSDAGQDGDHVFADFVKLYRDLRTRRGIQFFDLETGEPIHLQALILNDPTTEMHSRGQLTQQHFVSMGIRYEDGSTGLLVYVKPSLTGDEEIDLDRYRAQNPEFPHEPTSDQVFDEDQFESYRQLGYHIGIALCGDSEELWDVNADDRMGVLARVLSGTEWTKILRASLVGGGESQLPAGSPTGSCGDVKTLLHQFRTGDQQLRKLALKELASLAEGADAVLPELITDLRDAAKTLPNASDRAQLVWAIGTFGGKARAAARTLVMLLRDTSPEVRAACADALGELGVTTQTVRTALKRATRDEVENVRNAADQALRALGSTSAVSKA